jgi:hypothetical protein
MTISKSLLTLACLLPVWLPASAVRALPLISEVLYDAVGSDDGQVFVELYGPPNLDLAGFTVEGVNGADGSVTVTLSLTGLIPADGFFVVADESGGATAVANADLLLGFDFQNGPDSVVLRDPNGATLDALGYGSFGAADVFAGEGAAAPDPPAGQSLARLLADLDSDDNSADFAALLAPTPGTGPTQVPEPTTALLIAGACLVLTAFRRR